MEILSGLVVLGMLSFVFWIMWRGVSSSRSGGLAPKRAKSVLAAGLVGLVTALAVAQLAVGVDGLGSVSFGTVGIGVGVAAALLTVSDELAGIVEWGSACSGWLRPCLPWSCWSRDLTAGVATSCRWGSGCSRWCCWSCASSPGL